MLHIANYNNYCGQINPDMTQYWYGRDLTYKNSAAK